MPALSSDSKSRKSKPRAKAQIPLEDYPTGDGKPVAETTIHRKNMERHIFMLAYLLQVRRADPRAYVGGNLFVHYVEGNLRKHIAPDVLVTLDLAQPHPDDAYFKWVVGKGPTLVIELSSRSTLMEDMGRKKKIYAEIGVRDYILFDPKGEWVPGQLMGFALNGPSQPAVLLKTENGRLHSEQLDVDFVVNGQWLDLVDCRSGERVLDAHEQKNESDRRRALADKQRIESDLERVAADRRSAMAEQQRLEAENRKAEAEKRAHAAEQRAAGALAELERLKKSLGKP